MLTIPGHKGNANQNHTKILPHSSQNGFHQEHKQQQMSERGVCVKEPSHTFGGNVNEHNHYGKQCGSSSKN
jgi:hypothetical protein